jgi:hypothetical protein
MEMICWGYLNKYSGVRSIPYGHFKKEIVMETKGTTPQQLWGTEFDKQFTKDMLRELHKRASALIKRYERYSPRKSTDTADDRINTALMKLFDGARTWDPARVDLSGFLLGVIASDLTSELRRSSLAPQISLEGRRREREDDYTGEPYDEANMVPRASIEDGIQVPLAPESIDAAWEVAMKYLYSLAEDDKLVIALLDAYEQDARTKRDVMKLLKWSSRTYKVAYARLVALAEAAEPAVREAIFYAFTN